MAVMFLDIIFSSTLKTFNKINYTMKFRIKIILSPAAGRLFVFIIFPEFKL